MANWEIDATVRVRAFDFLRREMDRHGDGGLPRALLAEGFFFDGTRVPLLGPQGIFKPAILDVPLSITTVPEVEGQPRPYNDAVDPSGLLTYRYRGIDPRHRDNVGLRTAMLRGLPLVYFFGVLKGVYLPVFPVRIVEDDEYGLAFKVSLEASEAFLDNRPAADLADTIVNRRYASVVVQRRLHQLQFRERVLQAYQSQCAMCKLRHQELLDAAHIIPDSEERGEPTVNNGLALCKLHHAAFDRHILGVRPDLIIEVRRDILDEVDGPMLRYGLQGMDGVRIVVPRSPSQRPRVDLLEERYVLFKKAG